MTPSEILTRFEAALPTWQHLLNHTPQATFLGWIVLTAALDVWFSQSLRGNERGTPPSIRSEPQKALAYWWEEVEDRGFGIAGILLPAVAFLWTPAIAHPLFDVDGVNKGHMLNATWRHASVSVGFAALVWFEFGLLRLAYDRVAYKPHLAIERELVPGAKGRGPIVGRLEVFVVALWLTSLSATTVIARGAAAAVDAWGAPSFVTSAAGFELNPTWIATCFLLIQVAVGCASSGMALDTLGARTWAAGRRRVGAIAMVALGLMIWIGIHEAEAIDLRNGREPLEAEIRVLEALDRRLAQLPASHPAIIVAAAGGGSRAAVFAAMTFALLDEPWPRFAKLTGVDLPDENPCRSPFDDILVVTAVSGGSVASAHALARISWAPPTQKPWRDRPGRRNPSACPTKATNDGSVLQDLRATLLESPLVGEMRTDFYAPALLGVFTHGRSRAGALRDYWQSELKWDAAWEQHSAAIDAGDATRTAPLLLLNATSAPSGRRVPIGYPAVPASWWPAPNGGWEDEVDLAPFTTEKVMAVEDAVRLSASFPFGMSMATLSGIVDESPRGKDPQESLKREITDGGVLDNTGLDVLPPLLTHVGRLASEPACVSDAVRCEARKKLADSVLKRLCAHGVQVLEIDSGAKPGRTGWAKHAARDALVAYESLDRAARVRERVSARRARAIATDALGCTATQPALRVVYRPAATESPEAGHNTLFEEPVPTAWALGARDIAQLQRQVADAFRESEKGPSKVVAGLIHRVRESGVPSTSPAVASTRPDAIAAAEALFGGIRPLKGQVNEDPVAADIDARWPMLRRFTLGNTSPGIYWIDERDEQQVAEAFSLLRPEATAGLQAGQTILSEPILLVDPDGTRVVGMGQAGTAVEVVLESPTPSSSAVAKIRFDPDAVADSACAGNRVDIFACEGAAGAWERALEFGDRLSASQVTTLDNDRKPALLVGSQTSCLRTRLLPQAVNNGPGFGVKDEQVRFEEGPESEQAAAVAAVLSTSGPLVTPLRLMPVESKTPGYLSVFACAGANPVQRPAAPGAPAAPMK